MVLTQVNITFFRGDGIYFDWLLALLILGINKCEKFHLKSFTKYLSYIWKVKFLVIQSRLLALKPFILMRVWIILETRTLGIGVWILCRKHFGTWFICFKELSAFEIAVRYDDYGILYCFGYFWGDFKRDFMFCLCYDYFENLWKLFAEGKFSFIFTEL